MKRTIKVVYFDHNHQEIAGATAHFAHPNSASMRCFNNMNLNVYGAFSAQVYDEDTAELHAEFTRSINGVVRATPLRDPRRYMDPIRRSFHALINIKA